MVEAAFLVYGGGFGRAAADCNSEVAVSEPVRWTEAELDAYMARFSGKTELPEKKVSKSNQPRAGSGKMNKTEAMFAELLEAQRVAGHVIEWEFEPGPLLLSPRQGTIPATRYWRDFRVVMADGTVQAIEVKSGRKSKAGVAHPHFEDGARERLQMAAKKFVEYEWYLAWYWQGVWSIERII